MTESTERIAIEMWEAARADEQCVRVIVDDDDARDVRARIRLLARATGVKVRTGRMGNTVVAVRLDARVWGEDQATMRRKLSAE